MTRKTVLIAAAIALVFSSSAAFAHHPSTVTINAAAKKQPPVPFDHEKHMVRAKSCDTCHHMNKGLTIDSKEKVEKCSSCHLDPKKPTTPSMREMSLTKNPFHMKCISCHKTEKKGPVACTGCHIKK